MEDLLNTILMEVRNLSYLFFAFGAIWVILFGYLYSLSRRQNSLHDEIERLKAEREEQTEDERRIDARRPAELGPATDVPQRTLQNR